MIRRPALRSTLLGAIALWVGCSEPGEPVPDSAESTRPVVAALSLGSPRVTVSEPFGVILGIREVRPGVTLLADGLGKVLVRIDLDADRVDTLGHEGAGPGEYRQPGGLVRFRGDSTLLVDYGNGRLTVVSPDGSLGRDIPMVQEGLDLCSYCRERRMRQAGCSFSPNTGEAWAIRVRTRRPS